MDRLEESNMTRSLRLLVVGAVMGLNCDSATPGAPTEPIVIERIDIQSVEVNVGEARPAVVTARVKGGLGSGCDHLHSIEQRREGSTVTIEIKRTRFTGGPCTMIFKEFNQELGLPGAFAEGRYALSVNGVGKEFSVP
jgi:hypothetical protein